MFNERVEDGRVVVVHEYVGVDGWEAGRGVYFGDAQVVAGCDALDGTPSAETLVSIGGPVAMFGVVGCVSANGVPGGAVSGGVNPIFTGKSCVESELFQSGAWTWNVVGVVRNAAALWRVEGTGD